MLTNQIQQLDQYKVETIKETFEVVNQNFKSIFETLLPGATAKLTFVDMSQIDEGVTMQVAFNNIWKTSLGELSGGQRSLLALSLTLSLLKFKPAPLYILDEIDAALDASHTQNMGQMIKKHFPQSQFIIVSLKEGMFSNANVLYRTEFTDGGSQVKRYVSK